MLNYDTSRLLNREEFFHCLNECVAQHQMDKGQIALVLIDINRFNRINTLFGFKMGDDLLFNVGQRLLSLKRNKDILAQIGNDEFVLLMPGIQGEAHALLAVNKIINIMRSEVRLNEIPVAVDIVQGASLYPALAANAETLLQGAGIALREAKADGVSHRFFSEKASSPGLDWDVESELEYAIKNRNFELYYQPQVDIKTRLPYGAEALIRWKHLDHGAVPVDKFITAAEVTGQIMPMTEWIINAAMRQASEWPTRFGEQTVSINLSPRVLHEPDLADYIESAINIWGINADRLVLEVTESGIMENPERTSEMLHHLQSLGASISIDDFGTGYSSLAYFKTLPANELKIDRAFITNLKTSAEDQNLVSAVIALSKGFKLDVVAEGIEDMDTLLLLSEMGCDLAQGYYLSKPMTNADYQQWLEDYDQDNYWK